MSTDSNNYGHYFSTSYRGFTLQQTAAGWIIINFPAWARFGPTAKGPFETEYIARKQVDLLLDEERAE